jgi:hypothetical protein
MLDETVGEENITMYLDFVNKMNNKRKKIKNDNRNVNNENEDDILLLVGNDFSVKEILKTMKKKYNTTTNEEKCQNLNLFGTARSACNLILSDETINDGEVMSMTHKLMEDTGLCNISKRAILRLLKIREIYCKKEVVK